MISTLEISFKNKLKSCYLKSYSAKYKEEGTNSRKSTLFLKHTTSCLSKHLTHVSLNFVQQVSIQGNFYPFMSKCWEHAYFKLDKDGNNAGQLSFNNICCELNYSIQKVNNLCH